MNDPDTSLLRIIKIKGLAKMYFELPNKAHIKRPDQSLLLFSVTASKRKNHPHKGHQVYISRRALKHFVERRRGELRKNHTTAESLRIIHFAIDKIRETILTSDSQKLLGARYYYTKDYSKIGEPPLRIVVDQTGRTLEICSIHFRTKEQ